MNRYGFVANDPVNFEDPNGRVVVGGNNKASTDADRKVIKEADRKKAQSVVNNIKSAAYLKDEKMVEALTSLE